MVNKATASQGTASSKVARATASKNPTTTANSSKVVPPMVKVSRATSSTSSTMADKPMASSRAAQPTARDNMVKDITMVVSNKPATANRDMSKLAPTPPPPLPSQLFSLTAPLLVSKLKATMDPAEPRKAIAAS
jgi:hypothetical protein